MKTVKNSKKARFLLSVCAVMCGFAALPVQAAGNTNPGGRMTSVQLLTATEQEELLFMREEEKLARDVYQTLYAQWKMPIFANIAESEQQHTSRIQQLIQSYGLTDPVLDDSVGVFQNGQLSTLYQQLIAKGLQSAHDALYVGAFIEETDIQDLQRALSHTQKTNISTVYNQLWRGSRNHLRAFVGQIEATGITYQAQTLPQAEVDSIVNSPRERGGSGQGGRGNGGGGQRGGPAWR